MDKPLYKVLGGFNNKVEADLVAITYYDKIDGIEGWFELRLLFDDLSF